ncbi:MAG: TlpA family protein disulfide reductase [candidate division Zixibacteria bacterium]|nr:TlpA family protein disulfide reductase [candidate division Zixibacteria bacterium]
MLLRRTGIVLGLLAAVGAGVWTFRDSIGVMTAPVVQPGNRVVSVEARTLEGTPVSLDLTGHKTLLVFFKIDCPHCHRQLDNAERLATAYAKTGLRVVGLARAHHPALDAKRYSFPVYIDQSNAMIGRFGRVMVPTVVFTDETGTVRYIRSGAENFETDRQTVETFLRPDPSSGPSAIPEHVEASCCEKET